MCCDLRQKIDTLLPGHKQIATDQQRQIQSGYEAFADTDPAAPDSIKKRRGCDRREIRQKIVSPKPHYLKVAYTYQSAVSHDQCINKLHITLFGLLYETQIIRFK
jgi:hypothetical protein